MQLLPILLVLPLVLVDGRALPGLAAEPTAATPWLAAGLPAGLVLLSLLGVRLSLRRLDRTRRAVWMMRADRLLGFARLAIVLGGGLTVILGGWLPWLRTRIGDLVLVDEVLAIAPTVLGLAGTWAVQHALEVRLRDAIRLRRLDEGRPIWPTPGRGGYVLGQVRLQLGLLGVPILAVLGVSEAARRLAEAAGDAVPDWTADAASLVAAAIIFAIAPLLMRLVLPIHPMPPGSVREDLSRMAAATGVRVSDIMLWPTHGTLVNAAVIGVLPWLRYVLLTDAMLEEVPRPALRAVFAHELAHVRHRHVPWLVATVAGMVSLFGAAAAVPAVALAADGHDPAGDLIGWTAIGGGAVGLLVAGIAFGWVSRRYERQADTFAVQTMSREPAWAAPDHDAPGGPQVPAIAAVRPPAVLTVGDLRVDGDAEEPAAAADDGGVAAAAEADASPRVRPDAVLAMTAALAATARLNGVDPERSSWRHGSIAWRQRHLAGLVGRPVDGLDIDRLMRRLKLAAIGLLLAGVGATAAVDGWERRLRDAWSAPAAVDAPADHGSASPSRTLRQWPVASPRRPVPASPRKEGT